MGGRRVGALRCGVRGQGDEEGVWSWFSGRLSKVEVGERRGEERRGEETRGEETRGEDAVRKTGLALSE